jgi:hypothetical protein
MSRQTRLDGGAWAWVIHCLGNRALRRFLLHGKLARSSGLPQQRDGTHFRRHRPVAGPGFTHFVPSIPPLVQTSETSTSFSAHITDPSGLERTRNADAMSPGSPFGPCGPDAPGGLAPPAVRRDRHPRQAPAGPCGPGLDSPHAPSAASVRMAIPVQIVRMPQSPPCYMLQTRQSASAGERGQPGSPPGGPRSPSAGFCTCPLPAAPS